MSTAIVESASAVADPLANGESLYEVVHGQRVEKPMSAMAVWLANRLYALMGPHVDAARLGTLVMEMLFILDAEKNLRRRPDVAFVSSQRWPLDRELPYETDWKVAPDLAIEVISPHDLFKSVMAKLHEYFRHGVRQVWLVLPNERQIHVYESPTKNRIFSGQDVLESPELLPGLRLPLASLFSTQAVATTE